MFQTHTSSLTGCHFAPLRNWKRAMAKERPRFFNFTANNANVFVSAHNAQRRVFLFLFLFFYFKPSFVLMHSSLLMLSMNSHDS